MGRREEDIHLLIVEAEGSKWRAVASGSNRRPGRLWARLATGQCPIVQRAIQRMIVALM